MTHAVGGVDRTLGSDLGGRTQWVTRPTDNTVTHTLNGAGGPAGQPQLGNRVGRTVGQVTGSPTVHVPASGRAG